MGILNTLPTQIGFGSSGFVAASSSPYDVKIGDLEFMLAVGPENPLIRRGAEYRTQQVNFSGDPGETALGFWWQREQSTWHYGADNPTFDGPGAGEANIAVARFASSYGVNVWTPDELSLCDDTGLFQTNLLTIQNMTSANVDGTDRVYWVSLNSLHECAGGAVTSYLGSDPGNGWGLLGSVTSTGSVVWMMDVDNDSLWGFGNIDNNGAPVEKRKLYTGMPVASGAVILRFAKQRIIAGYDNKLYEINHTVTATTAFAGTPFYTHPNPDWVWTDVCEGPGALYASGYNGSYSAVYKFVLDTNGVIPTLTAGITALEMPAGETIHRLFPYLGLFIAVGTSLGVRICSFADTDIALAPLTYESSSAVIGITGWGDFLFANVRDAGDGYNGLIKIDLSREIEAGRFAWANDMRANTSTTTFTGVTGSPRHVVTLRGRPFFVVHGVGVFARQNTRRSPVGVLTSGRMLFGMTDPKHFLRIAMKGSGEGSVTLSTGVDSTEATLPQTTVDFSQLNEVDLRMSGLRGSTLTIGLTLTRDTVDTNAGPTVTSYSAKALPAQPRERQWIIPLRVYDRVEARNGGTHHQIARDVIAALEDLVRTQQPVLLQTFFGDPERDWVTQVVHVEDCEYRQLTGEPKQAWGGITTVSLRTLTG